MSEIEMNSGKLQQHGRVFSDQLSCNEASGRIRNSNVMEFQVEDFVAAIVRHKNLDKLLGYRIERVFRLLVHEYVDNNCLHHWLHECSRLVSPLTCGHMISSDVFADWPTCTRILNRKSYVSDCGLAKLYSPEWGITIMGSLGLFSYIAPEYASTGDFTEKYDIYSFGVLVMEIITGRSPVDRGQPQPYLVDRLKSMVAGQKIACVVDPQMPEKPSSEELKRVLLVALRCVDPDSEHRP
ncbi:hypothetical protein FF2_041544 [Malus domestica]